MSGRFADELNPTILAETTINERERQWHDKPPLDAYRSADVAAITGLTYRQLDYWHRSGLLRPSIAEGRGSGTQRRYSAADVRLALVIKRLLDAGVSLQWVRRALPLAREPEGLRWLLVSGREPVLGAEGELERLCREVGVCTVIDLGEEALRLDA